ncbi:MAG TPA: lipopolysaccharide kinase InaA family protein [Myxococcota bacterium]|nr:lipopolysaccharide kinase InaA family protein [Myxococcota bacterium]
MSASLSLVMARSGTSLRWWVDGERTPRLDALLAEPERVLEGPGSLAREAAGRKRFFRVDGGGEPALYVKVFTLPPGAARWRYFLRPSKARRERAVASRIERLGVAVVRPVAVGEERRLGVLARSFAVSRDVGARDLRALLETMRGGGSERRALLERFAVFARKLHDTGVDQDDFSPNNFLVRADGAFLLIDFERARVRRGPLGARAWTQLAKLHRRDLGISRSDRLRFLGAYLGSQGRAGRAQRRDAWRKIWPEFQRIRRRDARRAAASALQEGRNIAREGAALVVRARAGAKTLRLELAGDDARLCWVRAHQLERLGLPALRPARLDGNRVDLVDPGTALPRAPADQVIARSLAALAPYGRFRAPPQWRFTTHGAVLSNPHAFEFES